MTRVEPRDRIDEATKKIARNYQKGLKEVEDVKTKISDLELSVIDGGSDKNNRLNSALDMLTQLTDSMIFESERAQEECGKL